MKNILVIGIAICVTSLLSLPTQTYAAVSSQLEAVYHEQYDHFTNEIEALQSIIPDYETCRRNEDDINSRVSNKEQQYKLYEISKAQYLEEIIKLTQIQIDIAKQCLDTFNRSRGEQRTDYSSQELIKDMDYSKNRLKELTSKKQELKIKILESSESLPAWWIK